MENPTLFDLNEAIRRWQESLGASPIFAGDNLEELASHVRSSVARLRADGLSDEEAFKIAIGRIGERSLLEQEFAKVNPVGGELSARAKGLRTRLEWFIALIALSLVSLLLQPVGLLSRKSDSWVQPFSTLTLLLAFSLVGKFRAADAKPHRPVSDRVLVFGFLGFLVLFYTAMAVIIHYFTPVVLNHTPIWSLIFDVLVRLCGACYGYAVWRAQKTAMAGARRRA